MSSHWLQHCSTAACSYTPPSTFLTHFYVILTPDTPGLPGTPSGGLMAGRGDGDGFCLQTSGGREGLIRFENLGSRIRGNWVVMITAIFPTGSLTLIWSPNPPVQSVSSDLLCFLWVAFSTKMLKLPRLSTWSSVNEWTKIFTDNNT